MRSANELIAVSNFARKFLPHRLWDTAINNIMYAVKTRYYYCNVMSCDQAASGVSSVDAYVVVFSVTDAASFSFASACLQSIQRRSWKSGSAGDGPRPSVILVANKNDLVRNRVVTDYGNDASWL